MTNSARILDAIRRLVQHLRIADRAAQGELGISAAQLFVLVELGKTPALSLNELATRTHTDQSSVSVVVSRLVDAGLMTRDRDERDARRLVLNLTQNGRAIMARAPAVPQEQIIAIAERLPPDELQRFADSFTALVDALGAGSGPAQLLFADEGQPSRSGRGSRKQGSSPK